MKAIWNYIKQEMPWWFVLILLVSFFLAPALNETHSQLGIESLNDAIGTSLFLGLILALSSLGYHARSLTKAQRWLIRFCLFVIYFVICLAASAMGLMVFSSHLN